MRTENLLEDVNIQELTVEELREFPFGEILRALKYLAARNEAFDETLDYMSEYSLYKDVYEDILEEY